MVFVQKIIKYRFLILALSLVISLLSAFPIVNALAHGGDTSLIHGCIRPITGLLRIVGASTNCGPMETALDWPATAGGSTNSSVFAFKGAANSNVTCSGPNLGGPSALCTDPDTRVPLPVDGNLTSFTVWPNDNSNTSGGPATITILVNNAPTALQVQIPAGSTTIVVDTDQVTVQAGDLVTVQANDPTGNGTTRFTGSFVYEYN